MLDRGTQWIDIYPTTSNTSEHTIDAFQHFVGPKEKSPASIMKTHQNWLRPLARAHGDFQQLPPGSHKLMVWPIGPFEPYRRVVVVELLNLGSTISGGPEREAFFVSRRTLPS